MQAIMAASEGVCLNISREVEFPVPEQFKSTFDGKKLVTLFGIGVTKKCFHYKGILFWEDEIKEKVMFIE
ncbi:hypothetical protein NECAME_07108 [Necator americanus]|uniref:Uncharacterized protein n=1 Tax=Necator americanus TaxID=51031 RepID=W2TSK1_NECAM|nr:hypothetical protein NECAME_07108 [Necator americanus]ETN84012.1 hypothetical protein NECAME_07108 [Necator americanus]